MRHGILVRATLVASLALVAVAPASAQDDDPYTIELVDPWLEGNAEQYEVVPTDATKLDIDAFAWLTGGQQIETGTARQTITLPFDMWYFGRKYREVNVCVAGFIQFGGGTSKLIGPGASYSSSMNVGYWPNPFPFPVGTASSSPEDGIVAVLWHFWHAGDADGGVYGVAQGANPGVFTWTRGTVPNREFVIHWCVTRQIKTWCQFQVRLHEADGTIEMTWGTDSQQTNYGHCAHPGCSVPSITGMDAPAPFDSTSHVTWGQASGWGYFPDEHIFTPSVTRADGNVAFDQLDVASDGSGVDVLADEPARRLGAVFRYESQDEVVDLTTEYTTSDGDFDIVAFGLSGNQFGTLSLEASSPACFVVSTSTSTTVPSVRIATSVSFVDENDLGDLTFSTSTEDPDGTFRRSLQIAQAMADVHAFASTHLESALPDPVRALYDPAAQGSTRPTDVHLELPRIDIAGPGSGNDDALDASILARAYGRYLAAELSAPPSTPTFLHDLDEPADVENAFVEGFGLYLHAAATGATTADDWNQPTLHSLDLEDPDLSSGRAADVPGWVAAALYDLVDADNEPHDTIDGTQGDAAADPLQVLAALTGPPTPLRFAAEWAAQGHDAEALVANFIHHGLFADDGHEPNDAATSAHSLGDVGLRVENLTVNPFNEDWWEIDVPRAVEDLLVEADLRGNGSSQFPDVTLEVRRTDGTLVATGAADAPRGTLSAAVGSFPGGRLHVRVVHPGEDPPVSYALQAYWPFEFQGLAQEEWTEGQPFDSGLATDGGAPPFTLQHGEFGDLPPGLFVVSDSGSLRGTPSRVGTFEFSLDATDGHWQPTTRTRNVTFVVNDPLVFAGPALTGLAVGYPTQLDFVRGGGTDPVTITDVSGDLLDGLAALSGGRVGGTVHAPGSTPVSVSASDVAGSEAAIDTVLVACEEFDGKGTPVDLAADVAAAGLYVDALRGSTIGVSFKTAKKRAKRTVDVLVVGPDGRAVEGGKRKVRSGTFSIKKLLAPLTGRYFVLFQGDVAGEATQFLGTQKTKLPKRGAGEATLLADDDTVDVVFGALAGAKLSLKGKTSDELEMRVLYVLDPEGAAVPLDEVSAGQKKKKFTASFTCATSGDYTLVLAPLPGKTGDFSYRIKLKQPRKGVFSAD